MFGYRVVIPERMRITILEELLSYHFGLNKTKNRARSFVYWRGTDKEIERRCKQCLETLPMPKSLHGK